jgi:hypothetical protein
MSNRAPAWEAFKGLGAACLSLALLYVWLEKLTTAGAYALLGSLFWWRHSILRRRSVSKRPHEGESTESSSKAD